MTLSKILFSLISSTEPLPILEASVPVTLAIEPTVLAVVLTALFKVMILKIRPMSSDNAQTKIHACHHLNLRTYPPDKHQCQG